MRTELWDSAGNLRALNDAISDPNVQAFGVIPTHGEKFTVKSQVFYMTDGLTQKDFGPQPVDVRLGWTCSVYGYYAEYSDPKTVIAPSIIHTGDQPGGAVSFSFTFDENVCRESIERNESSPSPNPYNGAMWFSATVMKRQLNGEFLEWEGGDGPNVDGFALAELPDDQTYGSRCQSNTASAAHCTTSRGAGVNTATGAFAQSVSDVSLAGSNPVNLERIYSSNNSAAGSLGAGWTGNWDANLDVSSDGSITFLAEDGSRYSFIEKPSDPGTYTSPWTARSTLRKSSTGYELESQQGETLHFDGAGKLLKRRSFQGQETKYSYGESGRLTRITSPDGRTADFTYSGSLLSQISTSDGRNVSYAYKDGHLTEVTKPGLGKVVYGYDQVGLLDSITDPRGNRLLKNTYDSEGRISRQDSALSGSVTFAYKESQTDTTMPDGGIWTDVYHKNVLLSEYDPFGNKTSYEYTYRLEPVAYTDARGHRFVTTLDEDGNLTELQGPLTKQQWYYKSSGDLFTYWNANNQRSYYAYDTSHRLTTVTDPLGNVSSYTYTDDGKLQTVTDPRSKVTKYGYDSDGNRISAELPDGSRYEWKFDSAGRVISVTDPRGIGTEPARYTTTYGYDVAGRLESKTDTRGNKSSRTYDVAGNLKSETNATGKVTTFLYDAANRLTEMKDPAGRVSKLTYDVMGNIASRTDASGARTTYVYDKASRLISVTTARGNLADSDASQYTWKYGYDEVGNQVTVTDPAGNTTKTEYDAENRPVSVTDPLGNTRTTEYDDEGNVTKKTDALGKETVNRYDANNRLISTTDRNGKTLKYTYDEAGNLTSETSPLGSKTKYRYDDNSRLITTVDPRGNIADSDPEQYAWTTTYDSAGNVTSQSDPFGHVAFTNNYDGDGRLVARKDALGKTTGYTYDELGRLTKVTAPDGGTTSLDYDDLGNLTSRKDANGHTTVYGYDNSSRLTAITDPAGRKTSYGYDADGNRTKITNARGHSVIRFYDARNLLTKTTYSDGTPTASYYYDGAGRVKAVTDGTGTRTFAYDLEGRPTSVKPSAGKGTFVYTYDAEGRITSRAHDYKDDAALDWAGATQTAAADLNDDGITDVIRSDSRSGIGTYLGRGDGSFTPGAALHGSGTGFKQILPIDYTGDGKVDLLVIDKSTGHLYRYNGDGQGGFAAPSDMGGGWSAMTLTTGDFNGDGKQDFLAISSSENRMYFYPGKGNGSFGTRTLVGGGWATYRLISLDYNDDGKLDVLAINSADRHLYFYPGKGDGTLGARTDLGQGWGNFQLTPGDFTDDGKTDFVAVETSTHKLYVYPGTGAGSFGTRILQSDDWTPYGVPVTGRFNADTALDIAASDTSKHLRWWRGDGAGHLTGAVIAAAKSGLKTTYAYDDDGRVTGQTTSGKTTTYTYDPAGNLTATKLPTRTAIIEARTYDRAGRLSSVSEGTGARHFERDAAGRVTKDYYKDPTATGPADRYAYDTTGRMTRACTDADSSTSCLNGASGNTYTYDKVGNLTTSSTPAGTRTNTYDVADQLIKWVQGTTTADFSYDADGNLAKDGTGTYGYDPLGRLKSATIGANSYTFVNDSDGNRTITNKNGALSRTSRWDVLNPLAQIATETGSTGALIADYQYNPEGMPEAEHRSNGTFYVGRDRQSSVTAVYDSTGKKTHTYDYSDWGATAGEPVGSDGQASAFGYTGQYKDPTLTGRLHLRERSYDPSNQRFTSPDPEPAANDSPNPSSYAYANNDPVNQSDPSGRCPLCISSGIGALVGAAVESGIYGWQHRNGGFDWGDLASSAGKGAVAGAIGGVLMPGTGNVAARSLGLTGGRAIATSTVVNAGVGAGFSWALNEAYCRPTTPGDLLLGAAGGSSSSLVGPAFSWLKGKLSRTSPQRYGPGAAHSDDPAFRGGGAFSLDSIPEEAGFNYLYRGVSVESPAFDNATRGIAIPRGGSASMKTHHDGNTDSIYTSWTTSKQTALQYARGAAEGRSDLPGAILQVKLPLGQPVYPSFMISDDLWEGNENLVEGMVQGAKVYFVPAP
ncbi:FG-GAP-like repeat-containing protein [Streptomyces sp. NPDC048110]|uniref:FG-GAP-like repeat-containing protein n=1 Tax=Streptomyces sp. NPDC048110 TaxID=3155483 RepID=UPI0033C6B032